MIPYYIFLFVVMCFAFLCSSKISKKGKNVFLLCTLVVMVLFAGLRSAEIGTDASGYARSFEEGRPELRGDWTEQVTEEAGFYYLNKFLESISSEYVVLFIGVALLTYFCVLIAIRRETKDIAIPLFVFITLGLYTFVFNAARQGIAVGIYMLSFKYLFEDGRKGFLKYCAVVLIASLFHKTVIIAIPLYFLFRLKFSFRMLVLIGIIGSITGSLLPALLMYAGTLEERYALYLTKAGGGEMLTLFYVLITIFFIIWRQSVDKQYLRKYDVFLNMMLFGTMIYVVVQYYGVYIELTRFAAYFQVASIFLWSYIYRSKKKPRDIFSFAIIAGHLAFFFIFCTRMANLVPYMLNPQIHFN